MEIKPKQNGTLTKKQATWLKRLMRVFCINRPVINWQIIALLTMCVILEACWVSCFYRFTTEVGLLFSGFFHCLLYFAVTALKILCSQLKSGKLNATHLTNSPFFLYIYIYIYKLMYVSMSLSVPSMYVCMYVCMFEANKKIINPVSSNQSLIISIHLCIYLL